MTTRLQTIARENLDSDFKTLGITPAGSVQRKKPETKELADLLLKPLMEWKSHAPRKKRGKAGEEPPQGPSSP